MKMTRQFRIRLAQWIMPDPLTGKDYAGIDRNGCDPDLGVINDQTPIAQVAHLIATRTHTCLTQWANIQTLGDLRMKSTEDLMKVKNFGKISMADVRALWKSMGVPVPQRQRVVGKHRLFHTDLRRQLT